MTRKAFTLSETQAQMGPPLPTLSDVQRQQLLRYGPYWECFTGSESHYDAVQRLVGMGLMQYRQHSGSLRFHYRLSVRGKVVKAQLEKIASTPFPKLNKAAQP